MLRSAGRAAKYLLLALVCLYFLDWCVFEIRVARGAGLGSIAVDQYLKTPLKGSKVEYDFVGTMEENCARSAFPQYAASAWNPPCWWLERHRTSWQ